MDHLREAARLIREAQEHVLGATKTDPDQDLDEAFTDLEHARVAINDTWDFRCRRDNSRAQSR